MLTFLDSRPRFGRRDFLRVGSLALSGAAFPSIFGSSAACAADVPLVRDKSVVFLLLHGGPSQLETFDPKMNAPAEVRSVTGEVATKLSGVSFGGTFTKLAAVADRLAIVRNFTTGDGNHDIKPIVGKASLDANLGSIYARVAGTNHPASGMPRNAAIFPRSVDPQRQARNESFGKFDATGSLGSAYAPFIPGGDGPAQRNLEIRIPRDRIDDRRTLLTSLDQIRRNVDASGKLEGMDRFQQQAYDAVVGGVAKAFDLAAEDPRTVARYDTAPLVNPDSISKAWNNHQNYVDHVKSLGKLLLMARRLCEAGCGFVTVTTNFVWDMHADSNNATMDEGMNYCGLALDHAVSVFVDDLRQRGLADKILLVTTGEMGRTPRLNAKGGRDHWGGLAPLLLAGGGLQMGQVIGQSDRIAGEPVGSAYRIENLIATIMHTLLDVGEVRAARGVPADVARVIQAAPPIRELF